MEFETEKIEFKSMFTEDIYKEVIAFANADGGVLYVGIDNEGNAVGLKDIDNEFTRITNGIRDSILPDVTMFVKFTLQEDKVLKITVSEGSNKPYYLRSKGIKPSGVYVRQGALSVQASNDQIRQLIKYSDGNDFEKMRSLNQDLTFDAAAKAFERYGIEFSEEKYSTLGLVKQNDKLFTNLALILSDQCMHTTKVAVYNDEDNTVFKDSQEFSGSVFAQLNEAFHYLTLCNRTSAVFHGLERIEQRDYPEAALREALLNALIHRDYSFSGSIIINVNDNSIEFISIGGLLPGLTSEDITSGISQPRNKNLAEIFFRLRLIESYGTGIRRIFSLYKNNSVQPKIEITTNTFKIILPKINSKATTASVQENPQKKKIIDYILENGFISEVQIRNLLDVKKTRAYTIAKQMIDDGTIVAVGRGEDKKYLLRQDD